MINVFFLYICIYSYLSANFVAIVENLKLNKFVIVEFLEEDQSIEIVPSNWIIVDDILKQFICRCSGSTNASRYTASQKPPTNLWDKYDCIPRKFSGL